MDPESLIDTLRGIIAEQCEIPRIHLTDETDFQELGVGQVLAAEIVAQYQAATGVSISTDLFLDPEASMAKLEVYVTSQISPSVGKQSAKTNRAPSNTPLTNLAIPLAIPIQESQNPIPDILFMLPDGSGSALSYATLPLISDNLTIYGLNSPFLRSTAGFESIEGLARIWITEIVKLQSIGPYKLGGWSAGGYYVFEVANLLQQRGEKVDTMILIDTPCRTIYEALPNEVVQYLASANLMGNWDSGQAPQWLLDHFDSSIRAIETYQPTPLSGFSATKVFIIWAAEPVFGKGEAEKTGIDLRPAVCKFMLVDRNDFGAQGWDTLLPEMILASAKTPGNHFTIMSPENVSLLALKTYAVALTYNSVIYLEVFSETFLHRKRGGFMNGIMVFKSLGEE